MLLFDGGIVFDGGIYILMTEDVGNHVDVPGFVVQGGAIGPSKLMRSKSIGKLGVFPVFSNHILDASYGEASVLKGYKKRGFAFAFKQIIPFMLDVIP